MAPEFHARLSISIQLALSWSQISVCLQWEFQPTRAQPLLCALEGCVRKGWGGEEKKKKKEGIACSLAKMKNDNE